MRASRLVTVVSALALAFAPGCRQVLGIDEVVLDEDAGPPDARPAPDAPTGTDGGPGPDGPGGLPAWEVRIAASEGNVGGLVGVAGGPDGIGHLVGQDIAPSTSVIYVRSPGGNVVEIDKPTSGRPSVAVGFGKVHVVATSSLAGARYRAAPLGATNFGLAEEVAPTANGDSSLVVLADGTVYVAVEAETSTKVAAWRRPAAGGPWQVLKTWNASGNSYPRVRVGPDGAIHVFYATMGFDVMHDVLPAAGGTWRGARVATASGSQGYFGAAVGPDGNLHVTSVGEVGALLYTTSADGGTTWSSPMTIHPGPVQANALLVAADGTVESVHQVFVNGTSHLGWAQRPSGGEWTRGDLDDTAGVGYHVDVALGPDGCRHAAYYDSNTADLHHARRCP